MKCPSCGSIESNRVILTEGLQALTCGKCEGYWINSSHYWKWRDKQKETLPEITDVDISELALEESNAAKICPECSKILVRYDVGHDTGFTLDRCNTCAGIWFDKNEWEVLKRKNLHDEIHFIFSAPWQNKVKKERQEQLFEERMQKILGDADYAEAKRVRAWLNINDKRSEILAYLTQK